MNEKQEQIIIAYPCGCNSYETTISWLLNEIKDEKYLEFYIEDDAINIMWMGAVHILTNKQFEDLKSRLPNAVWRDTTGEDC